MFEKCKIIALSETSKCDNCVLEWLINDTFEYVLLKGMSDRRLWNTYIFITIRVFVYRYFLGSVLLTICLGMFKISLFNFQYFYNFFFHPLCLNLFIYNRPDLFDWKVFEQFFSKLFNKTLILILKSGKESKNNNRLVIEDIHHHWTKCIKYMTEWK